jgi:hypothetical protein
VHGTQKRENELLTIWYDHGHPLAAAKAQPQKGGGVASHLLRHGPEREIHFANAVLAHKRIATVFGAIRTNRLQDLRQGDIDKLRTIRYNMHDQLVT